MIPDKFITWNLFLDQSYKNEFNEQGFEKSDIDTRYKGREIEIMGNEYNTV